MNLFKKITSTSLIFIVLFSSCSEKDMASIDIAVSNKANLFVWNAMNIWYYWQQNVSNLDDGRTNTQELADYLNTFNNPTDLFQNLIISGDRFSWIVDDYVALEASFQGQTTSFGFEFGLIRISETDILGYVLYVIPGSPADRAGVARGDLFYQINGETLTIGNYDDLLRADSYSLSRITLSCDLFPCQVSEGTTTATFTREVLTENPIFLSQVLDTNQTKVGYLVYNQFVNNNESHRELNSIFNHFKNEGISEMVLDLRYNFGGSIFTAQILASLLYGNANQADIFASLSYNQKIDTTIAFNFYEQLPIVNETDQSTSYETMNRLFINRLFILTSDWTASASELIIAGLEPYMDIIVIGDTTLGKNSASITLYDSPSTDYIKTSSSTINSNHTYAIQPIVGLIANSVGFNDYTQGLLVDYPVQEFDYIDDLKPLGDPTEPLLAQALSIINGMAARVSTSYVNRNVEVIYSSKKRNPMLETIQIDPRQLKLN